MQVVFLSVFHSKLNARGSSIHATWFVHLSLLDLITLTISGYEYKLRNSSLSNFLHFSIASSLLDPNISTKLLNVYTKYSSIYLMHCCLYKAIILISASLPHFQNPLFTVHDHNDYPPICIIHEVETAP
jgi:hypothetical protein